MKKKHASSLLNIKQDGVMFCNIYVMCLERFCFLYRPTFILKFQ